MSMLRQMMVIWIMTLPWSQPGCTPGLDLDDDSKRIPLEQDLREYARQARVNLARLSPEQRALVEPVLEIHERAIAHYDRLMSRGKTRRAVMAPLMGTGAFILANDATMVGVADDVALPFLALGAVATALATEPPAAGEALAKAYQKVKDSAEAVCQVLMNSGIGDEDTASSSQSHSEIRAEPGTRESCIDRYVDCQQNAVRGYNRSHCQVCMDKCLVNEYRWPEGKQCNYRRPRRRRLPKGPYIKI